MISFLSFFQELQVFLHLLLVGECNASDSLQRVVRLVTEEICRRVLLKYVSHSEAGVIAYTNLHDLERLDLARVLDMRTSA